MAITPYRPATADDLLDLLTDQECDDLLGQGTRSFAGRPLRWRDSEGVVHACEAAMVTRSPDILLAWTLCNVDVPNAHYVEDAEMTCPVCARALIAANDDRGPDEPRRLKGEP